MCVCSVFWINSGLHEDLRTIFTPSQLKQGLEKGYPGW